MNLEPSTWSTCVESVTALAATVASGLLGRIQWQLKRVEKRVERLEECHGLDTSHYYRKKMKVKKYYRSAALFVLAAFIFVGCVTPPAWLMQRTIDKQGNEHYEPAPAAKAVAATAQSVGGPWGIIGGTIFLGGLTAWGDWLTNRKLKKHIAETSKK